MASRVSFGAVLRAGSRCGSRSSCSNEWTAVDTSSALPASTYRITAVCTRHWSHSRRLSFFFCLYFSATLPVRLELSTAMNSWSKSALLHVFDFLSTRSKSCVKSANELKPMLKTSRPLRVHERRGTRECGRRHHHAADVCVRGLGWTRKLVRAWAWAWAWAWRGRGWACGRVRLVGARGA